MGVGGVEVSSVLSSSTCGWHNENDVKISIILIARKKKNEKKNCDKESVFDIYGGDISGRYIYSL